MSQTILITGATDGIGLALARAYAASGARLVLVGKRPLSLLDNSFFSAGNYCQVDLARPDCAGRVLDWLQAQAIRSLDVVIHNAAVGYYGPVADQSPENLTNLLAVNLYAPIRLTHALLPMLLQTKGRLVFVSTVASGLPVPAYATYAAAKAALEGFARSLRVELGGEVNVQVVRPGAARTGMHAKINIPTDELDWTRFPPAEDVARLLKQAVTSGRPNSTLGFGNKVLRLAGYHLPGVMARVQSRRRPVWEAGVPASERPLAVITGAADGIGKALALRFARGGFDIGMIDIDSEKAELVQDEITRLGRHSDFVMADLTTEDGMAAAVSAFSPRTISVWVHNAGISHVGAFLHQPIEPQLKVLDLNLRSPLMVTARLLAQGRFEEAGAIIFLASLSKYVGYPGAAVYGASKDGLAAYAHSLFAAGTPHLHTLTVYPGPTRTAHARRYSPDNSREAARMPPDVLADHVFAAWQRRRRQVIPGVGNRLMAQLGHWLPASAEWAMKRMIFDKLA